MHLSEFKKINRHLLMCNQGKPKILFDNGNYQPKTGVFDMFEANTVCAAQDLRHCPCFISFPMISINFNDFETWLKHCQLDTDSKLQYLVIHELSSISFMGSEKTTPELIHVDGTTEKALDVMMIKMIKMNNIQMKYLHDLYPSTQSCLYILIGLKLSRHESRCATNCWNGWMCCQYTTSTRVRMILMPSRNISRKS
ncbi:hypothetical protein MT418_8437 [Batrachochytrium dendrobatidis]